MQAIMISIRPKWCELISNGKKTVEVRKTLPKIETPFKCYIYCTKGRDTLWRRTDGCYVSDYWENERDIGCVGKVIGEFVCDDIKKLRYDALEQCCFMRIGDELDEEFLDGTCISYKEACEYCKNLKWGSEHTDVFWGWHISDLVIYDRPRPLSGFRTPCTLEADCGLCPYYDHSGQDCAGRRITRPPRSWCYVEALP